MVTVPVPLETEVLLQDYNKRKRGLAQAEDLALKSAATYFGDELIHWLGIHEKAIRPASTEIVELEARHMYEDFLYEMENGAYYHFEFESDSISVDDLKRFREYEVSTARIYNASVVTYVICSSSTKGLRDSITEGINTYHVRLIRLKNEDAEKTLSQLAEKPGENIDRKDIIPLLFSPLMGGHNEEELKSIKEAISMTKLGQMIWDDAIEKGREEGERIGRQQASERYSRLILILNRENKTDLIIKIASDPEYREALYKEYGI